jgi:hypothetical protein
MRPLLAWLTGAVLVLGACGAQGPQAEGEAGGDGPDITTLAQEAGRLYAEERGAGAAADAARDRAAEYLRAQPGVLEVEATGSDSLQLRMDNGEELLLMLGRDRL